MDPDVLYPQKADELNFSLSLWCLLGTKSLHESVLTKLASLYHKGLIGYEIRCILFVKTWNLNVIYFYDSLRAPFNNMDWLECQCVYK